MTDRIKLHCPVCSEGIDVPNKGFGRAVAAAWRTQHQHSDTLVPDGAQVGVET